MTESYYWVAEYNDGTKLSQVEGEKRNKYTDIDRSKLVRFLLFNGESPVIILRLDEKKRLIYRMRVESSLLSSRVLGRAHLVGYQELVNGKNVQLLFCVFESDGRVEVLDGFREDDKWFYPVNLLPEEVLDASS